MFYLLCAVCDNFVAADKVEKHLLLLHPEEDMIRIRTWPDGDPVILIENEVNLL